MSPSPEREAQTQADRLRAAEYMMPAEIVQLQDDLAWWKDDHAKISAKYYDLLTAMMKGTHHVPPPV